MKTTKNYVFILFALLLTVDACEGPAGPQGAQVPVGSEGPIGPAGENGSTILAGEGAPAADLGTPGDFYLDTHTAELYGPKTEEGWGVAIDLQGARGPRGPRGPEGPRGPRGPAGEDGSQIYAGTTAPDPGLGKPGDFYFNKTTFDLYGPKTDSGWGTPVNLQATTNVMYSAWFSIDWNLNNFLNSKSMKITESRITEEFMDKGGVVLIYLKRPVATGDIEIHPLPLFLDSIYREFYLEFYVKLSGDNDFENGIVLQYSCSPSLGLLPIADSAKIRYILIPGSERISPDIALRRNLPVDFQNYQQVKKYFGVKN